MPVYSVPNRNETRRNLLRSVGVLGACATAGCLSRLEGPETQIAEVVLVNLNDETHTVELHIERSGEEVLRTTETVPADGPQPVLTSDDGVPTEQAEYTVVASFKWRNRRNQPNVSGLQSGRLLRRNHPDRLRRNVPGDAGERRLGPVLSRPRSDFHFHSATDGFYTIGHQRSYVSH